MRAEAVAVIVGAMFIGAGCSGGGTNGGGGTTSGGASTSTGAGDCKNASDGPAPAGRYEVVDPGTATADCFRDGTPVDGSGQVKDTSTGLVWNRYAYQSAHGFNQAQADAFCQGQGARLPTKDEALAISGASYDFCAWPCSWFTWTSTSAGAGVAWGVGSGGAGDTIEFRAGDLRAVLCVR